MSAKRAQRGKKLVLPSKHHLAHLNQCAQFAASLVPAGVMGQILASTETPRDLPQLTLPQEQLTADRTKFKTYG